MTKSQAKASLRKILEKTAELKDQVEDLKNEAEETAENIEPYEGKNDLMDAQLERQEWFEELASSLEELYDSLDNADYELSDKAE